MSAVSSVHRDQSQASGMSNSEQEHAATSAVKEEDVELNAADDQKPALQDAPRIAGESFWSPRIKAQRQNYIKAMVMTTILICAFIWSFMSIYWGSVWKEIDLSPNLEGWIINRDNGLIGSTVQQALLAANQGPKPHITWVNVDPATHPTQDEIDYEVAIELSTWIVVVVAENATSLLEQARASGNASWDPLSAISLTYATSRNFQVIPSMVLAPAVALLNKAIAQLSSQMAGEYLSSISSNATAVLNLAKAPQTIANPLTLQNRDLRPYDVSVAIALLVVGLIYLCILAFNATMANFGARQPLQPFLSYRSLVAMRFTVPLICYFFMSLMISLLDIPFKVPFGRTFSYGAGFMTWWAVTFTGMCVLGFVTECFISLVGPRFIAFALLLWIIINVSVANLPIELSPSFYRYGYSMPFYSIRSAYLKIIFDVGKRIDILKSFGILWAWLAVIFLTFPIWIWLEQRSAQKAHRGQNRS